MKDILQDILARTHSLGFLNLVKVTGTEDPTMIEPMAEDRSVIPTANTKDKVAEFGANIRMPKLGQIKFAFEESEYPKNSKLSLQKQNAME